MFALVNRLPQISNREDMSVELAKIASDFEALSPTCEQDRKRKISLALNTNRLRFDRLGLCGREEEIKKLRSCLSNLTNAAGNNRQLVLIRGRSGAGKSSLADTLRRPAEIAGGVYCTGKFDIKQNDEPLAAIAVVCKQLCQKMMVLNNKEKLRCLRDKLFEQLGPETMQLLSTLTGEIQAITEQAIDSSNSIARRSSFTAPKEAQLVAAFRGFFRAISTCFTLTVILLDDLQWADSSSIVTIKALISDSEISRMMIICCYRDNEVAADSIFATTVSELRSEQMSLEAGFSVTDVEVGNLKSEAVVNMLSELLSREPSQVIELSDVCQLRTQGNAFFLRAFLSVLVDEGLLEFNLGAYQWEWDTQTVLEKTSASPNLVELVQSRVSKLSEAELKLLQVAACLGNSFDRKTLLLAWQHSIEGADVNAFDETLSFVIGDSFLTVQGTQELNSFFRDTKIDFSEQPLVMLSFAHDNIQEAIWSVLSEEKRQTLQFRVGRALQATLTPPQFAEMIFVVTTLLNCGEVTKDASLAELNLQAGLKAKHLSAFSSVVGFVERGLENLDRDDMWTDYFQLALDLHSLGALAHQILGNHDSALKYCSTVIEQEKATPIQKCPVYKVKLDVTHISQNASASIDQTLSYLEELGCKFPKRRLVRRAMAGQYMKETKLKYIPSHDSIQRMPMMSDPSILETVQLLERAGSTAYVMSDMDLYVLIRCRFVQLVGKYGLTNDAAAAFASFANVLMNVYGDIATAVRVAELSLEIQKILPTKFYEARTMMSANIFVLCWVRPLRSQLKNIMTAYQSGLKAGNTFSAFQSLVFYLYCQFVAGISLRQVDKDYDMYLRQMRRSRIAHGITLSLPIAQLVHNLLAKSESTTELSGELIEDEDVFQSMGTRLVTGWFPRFKICAAMYFAEYDDGARLVMEIGGLDYLKKNFPGDTFGSDLMPFGLCCYAVARHSNLSKYRKVANQLRAEVQRLVRHGCINLDHALQLLDGEYHAMKGNITQAKASYSRAIVKAARSGFVQNAAVANERYGSFLLELQDFDEAAYYIGRAIACYHEWGAVRVVEHILKRHRDILMGVSGELSSKSLK